jgi:hypothetical protein
MPVEDAIDARTQLCMTRESLIVASAIPSRQMSISAVQPFAIVVVRT